jgi:hypothetical protein
VPSACLPAALLRQQPRRRLPSLALLLASPERVDTQNVVAMLDGHAVQVPPGAGLPYVLAGQAHWFAALLPAAAFL